MIETTIYVAVLAAMLVVLSTVYMNALSSQDLSRASSRLLQNQKMVELFLLSRLEEAQNIVTPASGTASTLVISSPTAAENPVTFAVVNGIMTMKLGAGSPIPITTDDVTVGDFTVLRGSGSPASVMVTVEYSAETYDSMRTAKTSFTQTLRYE